MSLIAVVLVSALAEETRVPDGFSFTGGSGRVNITCEKITIDETGSAAAEIVFGSPHYRYVKVDGEKYLTVSDENTSRVVIPVALNRATARDILFALHKADRSGRRKSCGAQKDLINGTQVCRMLFS